MNVRFIGHRYTDQIRAPLAGMLQPGPGYEAGWKQLMDSTGFCAPYDPTFAE